MANNEAMGSSGGLLLAFIAGAVTGAAIALLFAPASGEQTREYLGDRAREGRDRAADAVREGRERAADAVREGRERAAEAVRQGRDIVNKQRESVTAAFDRAREGYQQKTGAPGEPEV